MGESRDPDERYRGRHTSRVEPEAVEREGFLAKVPEWVVPLGAGFLLTSTLVTAVMTALTGYLLVTGNYAGALEPFEQFRPRMILAFLQSLFATVFQGVGTYFARRRTHWGTALLAGIFGSLVFITLPFTVPALVLLGLGKYHFALSTPVDRIRGE